MGRIWALCMGKNSHRYIFCVAHCPQEHSFIFKIAFPRFLHSWKPLALLWAKMRLFSCIHTTPQPFGFSPSNFVACLATLLRLAEKYPSSLQCLAWCPQCNIMPKVHHQAMGCPYWPPSLHFFLPAGHGVPRLAQRKRTRPLRLPPHPSGQLRCAGAPRSRDCCAGAADHGRVRDGWCYEHQCHRAPSRGRLRRARQPQLRRSASSTFTRS